MKRSSKKAWDIRQEGRAQTTNMDRKRKEKGGGCRGRKRKLIIGGKQARILGWRVGSGAWPSSAGREARNENICEKW